MLIYCYRTANWFWRHHIPLMSKLFYRLGYFLCNSAVPPSRTIGNGTKFGYGGIGVVIHKNAIIGRECNIGPNVTIGGKSRHPQVPVIGDNVFISSGAKILGPVHIGCNSIIGANAVVVRDIPDNCIAAGIPAKIIKENIDPKDYI